MERRPRPDGARGGPPRQGARPPPARARRRPPPAPRARIPDFLPESFRKSDGAPDVEFEGYQYFSFPMDHHEFIDSGTIGNPMRATKEKGGGAGRRHPGPTPWGGRRGGARRRAGAPPSPSREASCSSWTSRSRSTTGSSWTG